MQLVREVVKEIGGRKFTIGLLPFSKARKIQHTVNRILSFYSSDIADLNGLMVASFAEGGLRPEDLDDLAKAFASTTRVEWEEERPDGTVQPWDINPIRYEDGKAGNIDSVFTGRLEDYYEWLDECVRINFQVAAEKVQATIAEVSKRAERAVAEKDQKPQT